MPFAGFQITDAYRFAAASGLEAEARAIRSMPIHAGYDKKKRHQPRKAAFVELFETKGLMDAFVQLHWPTRNTDAGKDREQSYLDGKALNDRLLRGEAADGDPLESVGGLEDEAPSDADLVAFALEAHLRDFIIKNLSQIPIDGNRLRLYVNAEGRGGKEYPTNVGPIDILATDEAGSFFVFELKLDRGPDQRSANWPDTWAGSKCISLENVMFVVWSSPARSTRSCDTLCASFPMSPSLSTKWTSDCTR